MADLTITAANVRAASASTKVATVQLAEAVTAGQAIIKVTGESTWRKADANNAGASKADYAGAQGIRIALNSGSTGEFIAAASEGDVDPGATLAVGQVYIVSTTAGGIAPVADFVAGYTESYCSIIGIATATDNLRMIPNAAALAANHS